MMYFFPRRTSWTYRSIRMKLQSLPQHFCKHCVRGYRVLLENEWMRYCFLFVCLCSVCYLLFGWIISRDSCFEWEIRTSLCNDYQNGLVAGSLCYNLCIEKSVPLSSCINRDDQFSMFRWSNILFKALNPDKHKLLEVSNPVWDGMSKADFISLLEKHFAQLLGNKDHSYLILRAFEFADFNRNNELTYAEARSMWELLQIQEFQILFIFQDNTVFPQLNSTCGSMFGYETAYQQILYNKNQSTYLESIFPNSYQWSLPDFPRRAHIALGLLEYIFATMETDNTKFYMCDFSPQNFGYNQYYEMKVTKFDGIVSETVLNKTMSTKTCEKDSDCVYGDICHSTCNLVTGKCNSIDEMYTPDFIKVCHVLQDYLLYDMPIKVKYLLSHLVADCIRMGNKMSTKTRETIAVDQNIIHDRLNEILWNELKYADNKFLTRPTKKPPVLI
ncbi:Family with sequence similarity 69 member C [Mactra antiquata]